MSCKLAANRLADSKNTNVAETFSTNESARRRAAVREGKKPAKKNRSVGKPAAASAVIGALAPGNEVTAMSESTAARTSL